MPRFRIWTLMIVVVVVACACAMLWGDLALPFAIMAVAAAAGLVLSAVLSACFVVLDRCVDTLRGRG